MSLNKISKFKIKGMNASELRIGNWMIANNSFYPALKYGKVTHVYMGETKGYTIDYHYPGHWFEPIPLTPEILVGMNFTEDNNGRFWKDLTTHYLEFIVMPDGYYPVYAQVPELSSEAEQRVSLNRIFYIHQLQNLYFALTGLELTYKP